MAPADRSAILSPVWRDGIFADKVVFVTGGAGSICSVQTKALVYLGANACIIGRNVDKTERVAKEIAAVRPGAKVLGIGAVDVRNVSLLSTWWLLVVANQVPNSLTVSRRQSTAV